MYPLQAPACLLFGGAGNRGQQTGAAPIPHQPQAAQLLCFVAHRRLWLPCHHRRLQDYRTRPVRQPQGEPRHTRSRQRHSTATDHGDQLHNTAAFHQCRRAFHPYFHRRCWDRRSGWWVRNHTHIVLYLDKVVPPYNLERKQKQVNSKYIHDLGYFYTAVSWWVAFSTHIHRCGWADLRYCAIFFRLYYWKNSICHHCNQG